MFLLKKVFNFRNTTASSDAAEKPFLEHLEDLRDTITKIVLTLLVATIGCYIFHSELMEVLRRPIEEVWQLKQQSRLPKNFDTDRWETAKKMAVGIQGLEEKHQTKFFAQLNDPILEKHIHAAQYYRTAKLLNDPKASDEKNQKKEADYIRSLALDSELKETILSLIEKQPDATPNAKDKVVYMRSLKPTETFMLALKLSFFAAIVISFPLLLYFILQFILPGLKENEKKTLWPAMTVGFGLFLLGVCFAYFFVLPRTLDFFYEFSKGMDVENEWRIGDYITFATQFTLIFGLSFELPVIVMTLVKLGLLNYPTMSNSRAYAVLTIVVVAAVITPTGDAFTLMLLALPMCVLYECCIWFAYFDYKKQLREEAKEAAEWQSSSKPRLNSPAGVVESSHSHTDPSPDHDPYHDQHDHPIDYDRNHDELGRLIYPDHDEHGHPIDPHHDPYHDDHGHPIDYDRNHDEHGRLIYPDHDEHGHPLDPHHDPYHDEHGHLIDYDKDHDEHGRLISHSKAASEYQPYHDEHEAEVSGEPNAEQYPNGEQDPDYVDPTRVNHPESNRLDDEDKEHAHPTSETGENDTESCHQILEDANREIEELSKQEKQLDTGSPNTKTESPDHRPHVPKPRPPKD